MNFEKQPPCTCGGISVEERMRTMSPCSYCDGEDADSILHMFKALEEVKANRNIPTNNDFAYEFAKMLLDAADGKKYLPD
jgi:reverse gyrase